MYTSTGNGFGMKSLSVIAYALRDAKKEWQTKELSDGGTTNAGDLLMSLDVVISKIRMKYESLQESTGDPTPFSELFPDFSLVALPLADSTLDLTSLSVIAYALLGAKRKWRAIADNKELSDGDVADAEDYLMLLDLAFCQIRFFYEELRKNMKDVIPFDERFSNIY